MTRENSGFARFAGRVASAIALLAIIAGGLWVLLHWGRLDGWTSVNWRDVWAQPDDGRLLLGVLTAVGWLAWVLVVGTVLCEAVAALSRGRLRPRMPGSGWLRPAIAGLVITILGLSSASALMGHQPLGSAVGDDAPSRPTSGQVDAPVDPSMTTLTAATQTTMPYVVQTGDDLWSLAEQFAGGGENWRAIAQANDTVVLDPGVELTPGTMLMVPRSATSPQADASRATLVRATMPSKTDKDADAKTVAVQDGDTLWSLSEVNLGDGLRWPEIYDANQTVIADPNLIYPGQTLMLPAGSSESVPDEGGAPDTQPEAGPVEAPPDAPSDAPSEAPSEAPDGANQGSVFSYAAQLGAGAGQVTASTVSVPKTSTSGEAQVLDGQRSPDSMIASLLGSIGVGLAAALIVGIGANRLIQLRERSVGRSLPRMTPSMKEFETALDKRARGLLGRAEDDDDDDAAWVRPVAARKREVSEPMLSVVSDDDAAGEVDATVCLGIGASKDDVSLSLIDAGLVQIVGGEPQALGLMAAMAGQVFAEPAERRPEIMLAVSKLGWLASLLDCPLMPAEVAESLVSQRLAADGVATEQLVVFTDGYMPKTKKGSGITVVSSWYHDRRPDADVAIEVDDTDRAKLWVSGTRGPVLQAQLVAAPARRVLVELADNVTNLEFPKAPWWESEAEASGVVDCGPRVFTDVSRLGVRPSIFAVDDEDDTFTHPVLRLFGPVTLAGARGVAPSQATKQCLEYCGWLLQNPGQTSGVMAKALLVAEATRRSNMSRLRLWLGCDDAGEPYLPDAYSGRIVLHDGVTSDWDRMNALVGVINRASEHSLIDALRLVRGAPLADAAPGQWRWAEEWRCDMISLARDVAAVLCERALARDDVELARWAIQRGLLAAPDDVVLLTEQVRAEMQAGCQAEVERLAADLTRRASRAGFDLPDATATLLQEALEGGRRTRLAA